MTMLLKQTIVAAITLAGASSLAFGGDKYVSIASAPTGGVYYPIGGGLAALISRYVEGVAATAEATSGSIENVQLVGRDPTYLGLSSADVVLAAATGTGRFEGAPLAVEALFVLYPNSAQIVTLKSSGITSVEELRGRRVGTGAPGTGFDLFSTRLLTVAGMDPEKDVERVKLSTTDTLNALRDGRIDAMVFVGGVPASGITDLAASPGVEIALLPLAPYLDKLNAAYGQLYSPQSIVAGAYPGLARAVDTLGVWNMLVVNAAMPEEDVAAICLAIADHVDELRAVHPAGAKDAAVATEFAVARLATVSRAAFYPGL